MERQQEIVVKVVAIMADASEVNEIFSMKFSASVSIFSLMPNYSD